ncbi:MAG: hypothetical protein C5B51_25555 [Terriglobia bacterium]|nr:MAG: hypothetical protein C5B51_25555 [Terriglobia bacterium]
MKATRGFTLLEMMVATVILAVAVVGLLAGISGALRNASRLTEYDRAVQLSRLQMNELLLDERLPHDTVVAGEFYPDHAGGLESGWRARMTNFEMPPSKAPGQVAIQRIEMEVWWLAGGQRRTFTLDAYRPHVLRPQDLAPGAP